MGNKVYKKRGVFAILVMVLAGMLFINSCKKDDPSIPPGTGDNSIEIIFSGTADGQTFNLNDSFELTNEGFQYYFTLFKFYVSQVKLVKEDNSEFLLKDIDMIDFREDAPHKSFTVKVPEGKYKELKFGIGVDSVENAKDPASFPADHPLAASKGTYWGMAGQYRFFLMEGRMDTTMSNDSLPIPFAVHTGTNPLYREITFTPNYVFTKGDNIKATIVIDIDALLSNINFKEDHTSHTLGAGLPLATKVADNLAASMSLK